MPTTTPDALTGGASTHAEAVQPTTSIHPAPSRELDLSVWLLLLVERMSTRLAWFEAEDRRKANEIDRLRAARGERRRAA
jgi:hypothetical protein